MSDAPWNEVYTAEPLEGIDKASEQKEDKLICMWGETADTSNVQQTIWWPQAATAAGLVALPLSFSFGGKFVIGRWKKGVGLGNAGFWIWLFKMSQRDSTSTQNVTLTALLLQHFRCLLNKQGVPAAPALNYILC